MPHDMLQNFIAKSWLDASFCFQATSRVRRTQTLPNRQIQKGKPVPKAADDNKKKISALKNVDKKMANMILDEVVEK